MAIRRLRDLMFRIPPREFTPGERVVLHFVGWDVDDQGNRVYMTKRRLVDRTGFQPEKITQTLKKAERRGRLQLTRDRAGRIVSWRVLPIPACGKPGGKAVENPADFALLSDSTIDDRPGFEGGSVDPTIDGSSATLSFDEGLAAPPSLDPSLDPYKEQEASLRAASLPTDANQDAVTREGDLEKQHAIEELRLTMARIEGAPKSTPPRRRRFES